MGITIQSEQGARVVTHLLAFYEGFTSAFKRQRNLVIWDVEEGQKEMGFFQFLQEIHSD